MITFEFDVAEACAEAYQEADDILRVFRKENIGFFPHFLLMNIFDTITEETGSLYYMGLGAVYMAGYLHGSGTLEKKDRRELNEASKLMAKAIRIAQVERKFKAHSRQTKIKGGSRND